MSEQPKFVITRDGESLNGGIPMSKSEITQNRDLMSGPGMIREEDIAKGAGPNGENITVGQWLNGPPADEKTNDGKSVDSLPLPQEPKKKPLKKEGPKLWKVVFGMVVFFAALAAGVATLASRFTKSSDQEVTATSPSELNLDEDKDEMSKPLVTPVPAPVVRPVPERKPKKLKKPQRRRKLRKPKKAKKLHRQRKLRKPKKVKKPKRPRKPRKSKKAKKRNIRCAGGLDACIKSVQSKNRDIRRDIARRVCKEVERCR